MQLLQMLAQRIGERAGRDPAHEAGEQGDRPFMHLQQMLAHGRRGQSQIRTIAGLYRVADKIADCREHAGDCIGIQVGQLIGCIALQQQP